MRNLKPSFVVNIYAGSGIVISEVLIDLRKLALWRSFFFKVFLFSLARVLTVYTYVIYCMLFFFEAKLVCLLEVFMQNAM